VSIIAHAGTTDSLRIVIPATVAPYYGAPPGALNSSASLGSLDLSVSFQMTGNITSITSTSHTVTCSLGYVNPDAATPFNPTCAYISLHTTDLLQNDVVLELESVGLDKPRCFAQRLTSGDEVTDALSLTIVPRFTATPISSQEYIFLVDRSGSMSGGRIQAVRDALQIMVRSLPSNGTTFNMFSFGDSCNSLWPTSQAYDAASVDIATRYIDAMDANYGGTQIASAFEHVFKTLDTMAGRPISVFILTDGEAWDLQHVFAQIDKAVKTSNMKTRVFAFGVGNQVSKEVCYRFEIDIWQSNNEIPVLRCATVSLVLGEASRPMSAKRSGQMQN